ncbi:hypothetical protein AAFO92_13795 [Roseovarius sp. CAU 1744]|uniref:hypothetical protein n=1 Tax=Roseovarius sp. CAU 1744 TaxID=3140368 RepID=UPI00325B2DCE
MGNNEPKYTAAEFSCLVGTDLIRLRDWRRRGFLDFVGIDFNGRWRYSMLDVCVLKVAEMYRENGMDLRKSLWFAYASMAFLFDQTNDREKRRFLLLTDFDNDKKRRLLTAQKLSDLQEQIENLGAKPIGDLVDLEAVRLDLPKFLSEAAEAARD